jgi:hypothetical protein
MKTNLSPFLRFPFSVLLLATALACSEDAVNIAADPAEPQIPLSGVPIAFTGNRGTHNGGILPLSAGDRTTDNLTAMTVYAHYTGAAGFDDATASTPNFMFAQSVTKGGSGWTYAPLKYWPAAHEKVSFFAIAPAPDAPSGIALVDGDAYTGYPAFTVTPSTTPAEQLDICVASALNFADNTNNGTVPFHFDHTMAKVAFAARYTGSLPLPDQNVKISSLRLAPVAGSGTFSFDATAAGFNWSVDGSSPATYTLSQAAGDLTGATLPPGNAPGSNLISTDPQGLLLLVPQTTPPDAKIELTADLYDATNALLLTRKITAPLPTTTWEAGKQVTCNLTVDMSHFYDVCNSFSNATDEPKSAIDMIRNKKDQNAPPWVAIMLAPGTETVNLGDGSQDIFDGLKLVKGNNSPATVVIDGGGREIQMIGSGSGSQGALITVRAGVTLTLRNITLVGLTTDQNSATIDNQFSPLIRVQSGGHLILEDGAVIKGNTSPDSDGGGVYVMEGVFDMTGGTISGNIALDGGGVVVWQGVFNMTGGTISGNTALAGGGVAVMGGGVFNMTGGTISGNTADNRGGGVYVEGGGAFHKTGGGTIYGDTDNTQSGDENTAMYVFINAGHAVLYRDHYYRNATLYPEDDISTGKITSPPWDNE